MRGIIFTSGTEFSVLSKVNLGSGLKPCWQDSDSLAVFDGSGRNLFIVSDNFGSSATFGGNVAEGATQFDAIYPYVAARSASAGAALPPGKILLRFGRIENGIPGPWSFAVLRA